MKQRRRKEIAKNTILTAMFSLWIIVSKEWLCFAFGHCLGEREEAGEMSAACAIWKVFDTTYFRADQTDKNNNNENFLFFFSLSLSLSQHISNIHFTETSTLDGWRCQKKRNNRRMTPELNIIFNLSLLLFFSTSSLLLCAAKRKTKPRSWRLLANFFSQKWKNKKFLYFLENFHNFPTSR